MSSDSTRWTVIQRAAAGSAADRENFARRYAPIVRTYLGARWRGTPLASEVEDAAQLVFLDCFKENGALSRLDPDKGSGFRPYLYGIARNVALSMERKCARSRERQSEGSFRLDAHPSDDESCARAFDRAWASAVLRDAVDHHRALAQAKGPDALRRHRLLILRHGEDLTLREIASRWEVEREVVYREYRKAREEFRRALVAVVRDLHGGGPDGVEREVEGLADFFD